MNAKDIAKEVIKIEGLEYMSNRINDNFDQAIKAIISTAGRTRATA